MNNNQTPPDKPGGNGGPGGSSSASVTHSGATEYSSNTTVSSENFASTSGGQNALLVTSGSVVLENPTVTKSGDESSENSDFYGTNAAVLVTGGSLEISGGSVTTSGAHANGVFAYGNGNIVVKNTTIKTESNNSGAIMVTGGGSLTAENVTAETAGNSSAPIRSDRGGGTMTVSGGSFISNGVGSPAVYSTANISISNATLTSNASEGIVIEGSNSVKLESVTLTDTNTTLNGNSETYKNIFIYQSMSGDAEEGTGTFSATGSTITTNQGDTFYITNTTANIELSNNRFINNDASSAFLRAEGAKWGTSGSNGGLVTLSMTGQVAEGDIILDNISTLNLVLENQSFYMGAINSANTAKSVSVTLDATSQLILAGDSYVNTLTNADSTNMNIYSNGYKLYVAGEEVEINGSEAPETPEVGTTVAATETEELTTTDGTDCGPGSDCASTTNPVPFIVGGIALLVIIAGVVAVLLHNKKKKGPKAPGDNTTVSPDGSMTTPPAPNSGARPDFSQFDDSGQGFPPQA